MRVFYLVGTLLVFVIDLPAYLLSNVTGDVFSLDAATTLTPQDTTPSASLTTSFVSAATRVDEAVCRACRMNELLGKREVSAEQLEKYRVEKAKMDILGHLGLKAPPEFPGEQQDEASRRLIIDSLLRKDQRAVAKDDSAPGGSLALDGEDLFEEEAADEPESVETETVVFGSAGECPLFLPPIFTFFTPWTMDMKDE
jgi:hypothetical protein